jgi:DNA-binding NarL/FixJ family response regulator
MPQAPPKPKSILIADDSVTIRTLVRTFLESHNLNVCGEACDGVDAIEKAKSLKPDLILLDFAMPRLSGIEAASVLKKLMPKLRIVLFTMFDDVVAESLITAVGVDVVLSKPDGLHTLIQCIENLFRPGVAALEVPNSRTDEKPPPAN